MRVLIVKTSSMGDIIHTLPALTDAGRAIPGIKFDWVVEENFVEIPQWHPLVENVIPMALRRWRRNLVAKKTRQEWQAFRAALRATHYDLVIDAQGLLKSAFIALHSYGRRVGFNSGSARESLAALFYHNRYRVSKAQHAITRTRNLFSQALGYAVPTDVPDYGINRARFIEDEPQENYLVFLHGTTWDTKHWPEEYWVELAKIATNKGYHVKLPWGNATEQERAQRIALVSPAVTVLPRHDLKGMAKVLAGAAAVVAVDTGLCHLTAALDVPAVSLYGPTNPVLSGALGRSQKHLSAQFACAPCMERECRIKNQSSAIMPCFETLPPELVWNTLSAIL